MNAEEARKISEANTKFKSNTVHLMNWIEEDIRVAAIAGRRSIQNVLTGIRTPITSEQRESCWKQLRELGYEVVHHGHHQMDADDTEVK